MAVITYPCQNPQAGLANLFSKGSLNPRMKSCLVAIYVKSLRSNLLGPSVSSCDHRQYHGQFHGNIESRVIKTSLNKEWILISTQIAKFMGPTWGPPGSCRPLMDPMLVPWTLLSGYLLNTRQPPEVMSSHCNFLQEPLGLWVYWPISDDFFPECFKYMKMFEILYIR